MEVHLAATLGALFLALLIYRYDMYDREPWYMLLLALGLGSAAGWALGEVEDWILRAWAAGHPEAWQSATVASGAEEAAKFIFGLAIMKSMRQHFNDPMDGLMYGSFIGLGLGLEESYFFSSLGGTHAGSEMIRLVLHALWGGLGGFGLGMWLHRTPRWGLQLAGGFGVALLLHFTWDLFGMAPSVVFWQRGASILLMLLTLGLFGQCVVVANHYSREKFSPETTGRLTGWPFTLLNRLDDAPPPSGSSVE